MKSLILSFVLASAVIPSLAMAAGQDLQAGPNGSHATLRMNEVADSTGKDWKSIAVELPPGAVDSWQSRAEGELLYVLEGAGRLEVGGKSPVALNAGSVTRLDGTPRLVVKNTSRTKTLKVLIVFVQEKGEEHPLVADRSAQGIQDNRGPFSDGDRHFHGRDQQESVGTGLIF
jgi:quercetin dioxygenase-like cupin family protein